MRSNLLLLLSICAPFIISSVITIVFFLSCSFLAIAIATEGLTDGPKIRNQPISSTFCILPFLIVANLGPGSALQ